VVVEVLLKTDQDLLVGQAAVVPILLKLVVPVLKRQHMDMDMDMPAEQVAVPMLEQAVVEQVLLAAMATLLAHLLAMAE